MSTYVEVPFLKGVNGFDTTFPVSLSHCLDPQTYLQALQRINGAIQSVRYPRPVSYLGLGTACAGGALVGYGVVGGHQPLAVAGGICLFVCIIIFIVGGVMKSKRVRQALTSALIIENDRFMTATPAVSFRLFEQQVQEVVAHYDPHHHRDPHHHHHDRHHHHNRTRGDWHYDTRTRVDWKLIVEVAVPPQPVIIQQFPGQPQYAQPIAYAQPGYAQPYPQQQYAQPGYVAQPVYAQPQGFAQQPAPAARRENVNTPLISSGAQDTRQWMQSDQQQPSDSSTFENPTKPNVYLSPSNSAYGSMSSL